MEIELSCENDDTYKNYNMAKQMPKQLIKVKE